jgi:hypothetical protein
MDGARIGQHAPVVTLSHRSAPKKSARTGRSTSLPGRVRPRSRLPPALLLSAALLTAMATAIASCTVVVGIEQCRTIETARCQSAARCGFSEDEVLRCTEFYHDQCLHGIENASEPPGDSDAKLCVDAIRRGAGCACRRLPPAWRDRPQAPLLAGNRSRADALRTRFSSKPTCSRPAPRQQARHWLDTHPRQRLGRRSRLRRQRRRLSGPGRYAGPHCRSYCAASRVCSAIPTAG